MLLPTTILYSQQDTTLLNEVEISSSRAPALYSESARVIQIISKEEIQNAPVSSLSSMLEYVSGLDIRQRGAGDVQADISLRGGSFEQTLVLLNGIPWNNPQTGHHNLDIPFDLSAVDRIEILEGPGSRIYGPNAFSGAINIITGEKESDEIRMSAEAGEHDTYKSNLNLNFNQKRVSTFVSTGKRISGGYIKNTDYDISHAFINSKLKAQNSKFSVQLGYLNKAFGALAFFTPKYPDQYEKTRTQFASLKFESGGSMHFSPYVYWKRHHDSFDLFRYEEPEWYSGNNFHMTDKFGGGLNSWFVTGLGKTSLGLEWHADEIKSNVLGKPMMEKEEVKNEQGKYYTHQAERQNLAAFAEHNMELGKLHISAGLLANWNSDYPASLYPGVDISYKLNRSTRLIASANKSLRLPSYTDLYYEGPTNTGNPDLKPEESLTYEAGVKHTNQKLSGEVVIFHRQGDNIIDWVKTTDTAKWQSRNLTSLQTTGIQLSAFVRKPFENNGTSIIDFVRISYTYIAMQKSSEDYISRYALDQLKHKASVSVQHRIYRKIGASWLFTYQDRNGSYFDFYENRERDYEPFFLANARIFYQNKLINIYLEANNLFDTDYFDHGNILMPGRWMRAGLSLCINY